MHVLLHIDSYASTRIGSEPAYLLPSRCWQKRPAGTETRLLLRIGTDCMQTLACGGP